MIKSFKHGGLESFFTTGSTAGIQSAHAAKLRILLAAIHAANNANDLRTPPSWRLHKLSGKLKDYWSLTVNGNWRIVFTFEDGDAYVVDYLDYH